MARPSDRKKATGQRNKPPDEDAMEGVTTDGQRNSDEDELLPGHDSDKDEDDEDSDEEAIPMRQAVPISVPRKKTATKTLARSTKAEDRATCTAWYQTFLGVKTNAAEYLYDEEDLDKPSTWVKLSDKTISMIVKGCRDSSIHVSASAVNKMGLLAFLCMHHERIQRPLLDLTSIDEDMLEDIERQKKLEDHYNNDKPSSDPPSLTLDDATVTKSINIFEEHLGRMRGINGHPLKYVLRHAAQVIAAHLDLPFGDPNSNYVSMDDEMVGRAAIYSQEVDCDETDGPWSKVFLIDAATVFALMEKAFGKTTFWTNAKQFSKKKEGRKAWRALIKYHFGNDRSVTIAETLRTKLQNAVFEYPKRNWDFNKYCNLHTSTYACANDMLMYQDDQTPTFSETQKIQLFQTGITDPYFATIKGIIGANRYKYPTFESVKEAYINYMRTSPRPEIVRTTNESRTISETKTGRLNRGGPKTTGNLKPSQAEIDACTHIQAKKYTKEEYAKFSAAEKAKHYQLKCAVGLKKDKKREVAEIETNSEVNVQNALGPNSTNSALARQDGKIAKTER